MKKEILMIAFLIIGSSIFAQKAVNVSVNVPKGSPTKSTVVIDGVTTYNYSLGSNIPINGSPYMDKNFANGVIELNNGLSSGEVLLRYNLSSDLFEILRDNDTLILNRPYAVKNIYLDDKVFIFDPKLRKNAERKYNGYFQLAIEGELSLFIKRRKELSYDNFVQNYQGGSGTKEYYYVDKKPSFVGKTEGGKVFLLKSKRTLLSNLKDHKDEMKAYLKENKIRFSKEDDVIQVIEYYNSL